jgi:hypothetical protein
VSNCAPPDLIDQALRKASDRVDAQHGVFGRLGEAQKAADAHDCDTKHDVNRNGAEYEMQHLEPLPQQLRQSKGSKYGAFKDNEHGR